MDKSVLIKWRPRENMMDDDFIFVISHLEEWLEKLLVWLGMFGKLEYARKPLKSKSWTDVSMTKFW